MAANKHINVDGFTIGGEQCYIIAEVGSNHMQDMQMAKDHIDAAVDCGANAVKFQSIQLDKLYFDPSPELAKLVNALRMDEAWHKPLNEYCKNKGVTFFSSPTYLEAVDIQEEVGVSLYKLASAQVGTFPQMVKRVAETGKPTIFSTGIVSFAELERTIKIFEDAGNQNYILLHCNSIYPTPFDRVNLGLMDTYKEMFDCVVGFSDHTEGIYVPVTAVARGAKVIEKHFSLSRELDSPDAPLSMEPAEFAEMVKGIRAAEASMGKGSRLDIQKEEKSFKESILSRLVLNKPVSAGTVLKENDFSFLRYGEGIDCREMEFLLRHECKAKHDLKAGAFIYWTDLELG